MSNQRNTTSKANKYTPSIPTFPQVVWVRGEGVVDGAYNLIHALDVGDAWVELGVDEENALHHLPVSLTAVGQNLILVGGVQVE